MKIASAAMFLALAVGTGGASAAPMSSATFTIYEPAGSTVHNDPTVTGSIGGGVWSVESFVPFFGFTWTAYGGVTFGPGSYTIPTSGGNAYVDVLVGPGQMGGHILWDWAASPTLDIVNVWDVSTVGGTTTYTSTDGFAINPPSPDGVPGYAWLEGPFQGFSANFDFQVPLADQPSLLVIPVQHDFGNVRVGTTSGDANVIATNDGDPGSILANVVLGAAPGDFNGGPSAPADLGQGDSTSEAYSYTPGEIGSDTETVTVTADSVPSQDVTLTGNGVGPIFDLNNICDSKPDNQCGALESLSMGGFAPGATAELDLELSNLFGINISDALTDLTVMNLGLTGTGFSVKDGTMIPDGTPGKYFTLNAGNPSLDVLLDTLVFDTSMVAGTYTGQLMFTTDVGTGLQGSGGNMYTFNLSATITGGTPAPVPGVISLMSLGLAGIGWHRRKRLTA